MDRFRTKVRVVNAFTSRGGTQLPDPNDKTAEPEPTGDPPPSAQQQASAQPVRQGSFHNAGQPYTPIPPFQQPSVPPYQYNYFAAAQTYQHSRQNYNDPQPPLHAQQGWSESTQPYPPQDVQPPQTPTNQTAYTQPLHSYANSTSSYDSQYTHHPHSIHSYPPPQASSVPPHANADAYSPPQHQEPYPPQPSFQRSHTDPDHYSTHQTFHRSYTEPQPAPSYGTQFSGAPWPRDPAPDRDCDQCRYAYSGTCLKCSQL